MAPTSLQYPAETAARIKKFRKAGFTLPDDATVLDTWKCEQILFRRKLGLEDDARYRAVFDHLHKYGQSRGATWQECCSNLHISDVGQPARLAILRQCRVGELLHLEKFPQPDDLSATAILRSNGDEIGKLPSNFSITKEIDEGVIFVAVLKTISARIGDSRAYYELKDGELIGEVLDSHRKFSKQFFPSLMANLDVFSFDPPWDEYSDSDRPQ